MALRIALLPALLSMAISATAQGTVTTEKSATPANTDPPGIARVLGPFPLYLGPIPRAKPTPDEEFTSRWRDMEFVNKVSKPSYTVYLPPISRASGASVLVFPGGGYTTLSWEMEGQWIARAFQDHGVAAVVVKYRLPSDQTMEDKADGPLQDAQQALLDVRQKAKLWGLNPNAVGAIGFSAGGHLASMLGVDSGPSLVPNPEGVKLRPDFLILIYPVVSFAEGRVPPDLSRTLIGSNPTPELVQRFSSDLHVDKATPPTLVMAAGDDIFSPHSLTFYQALRGVGVPAELILFDHGQHGFFGLVREEWSDPMWRWMSRNGWMR